MQSTSPIRPRREAGADALSRRRLLWLGAGLGGVALAACRPEAERAGGVLKVGSQKGGAKALMLASGVLAGAPYRVEWSDFPAAQHLLEALAAEAVDLGAVGDAPFLFAYAGGARIKAVQAARSLSGGSSTEILVPKASPIRVPADLKGRRIATGRGSVGHYLTLRVLERAGISPSEATIVFLSPSDAKAAFGAGAVDAWSTWGPYVPLAIRDNGARRLVDGEGLLSGYAFQAASQRAVATKRAELSDFLQRQARAERWGAAHKPQYAALLSRETGLDPEIAAATVAKIGVEPVAIDRSVVAEEMAVLKHFQDCGAVTARPDLSAAFDASFNATVLA